MSSSINLRCYFTVKRQESIRSVKFAKFVTIANLGDKENGLPEDIEGHGLHLVAWYDTSDDIPYEEDVQNGWAMTDEPMVLGTLAGTITSTTHKIERYTVPHGAFDEEWQKKPLKNLANDMKLYKTAVVNSKVVFIDDSKARGKSVLSVAPDAVNYIDPSTSESVGKMVANTDVTAIPDGMDLVGDVRVGVFPVSKLAQGETILYAWADQTIKKFTENVV